MDAIVEDRFSSTWTMTVNEAIESFRQKVRRRNDLSDELDRLTPVYNKLKYDYEQSLEDVSNARFDLARVVEDSI